MEKDDTAKKDDSQQLLSTALALPKFVCFSIVVIVVMCTIQVSFLSNLGNPSVSLVSCEVLWVAIFHSDFIYDMNCIVLSCGLLAVFIHRRFRNCTRKTFDQKIVEGMPCSEITVIIPCFLPNEQDIIEETIQHVMNKVRYPGMLKLIVVYNTPKDMPEVEGKLQKMAQCTGHKDGRQLEVMRVHSSRTKAENLTYALSKTCSEYIVIYDADHHPDPGSLMRLYQEMWEQNADSVMGSLYIRNLNYSLMARWCDIDLFYTHFTISSGMALWTRLGFFGGSNAILRKDALASEQFNPSVQCEDIDLSARLLLANKKLVLCPEARCGELAPANYKAFYKQRLRWFMGWDEVTFKYIGQANFRSKLACYYKAVFPYMFVYRWIGPFGSMLNLFSACWWITFRPMGWSGNLSGTMAKLPEDMEEYAKCNHDQTDLMKFGLKLVRPFMITQVVLSLLEGICQACNPDFQRNARQCVLQLFSIVIYAAILPFYMIWFFFVEVRSMYKIFTNSTGDWVVTVRGSATTNQNTNLGSPLLGN